MALLQELRRRWWLAVLVLLVVLMLFGQRVASFYTDVLWYQSVGYVRVFWTLLTTELVLGIVTAVVMTVLVGTNLFLARRLAPSYRIPSAREETVERYRRALEPYSRPILIVAAVVVGILSGLSMAPEWPRYVLWANATEFGQVDPQFGRDLGYFMFVLPFHTLVNSWLFTALVITILLTAAAHYVFGGIRPQSPGQRLTPQSNVHMSVLLALLVGVRAWGFWLDRYLLSYSQRGQATGLSYTDVHAQLVGYQLLTVIAVVCMLLFLANIFVRGWLLPTAGVGILLIAAVVLSGIYPAAIQRVQVDPQELARERPFIERNIELTRYGYGLDDVESEQFPATAELSAGELANNAATLQSVRLWDPDTLQNTYQQLQVLRQFYDFWDVDVDRYTLEGDLQQVMISAREIRLDDIPAQAQTWQNERLVYTHGYGLVSSAVSSKTEDGQPVFLLKDIPPEGVDELGVTNPRIYFGEEPPDYSIIGTEEDELDYVTAEDEAVTHRYEGDAGVGVGSLLRRLAFAFRYTEPNILLSRLMNSESKVLFHRDITERIGKVAPYLKLDHDPYPVAADGRIKWVVDAYTTSEMLPYSERVELAELTASEQVQLFPATQADGSIRLEERVIRVPGISGVANYIRNSVKAVVDAYDGTVTLYVVDPDDPVIQAWRNVFPDSFTSLGEASDELQAHFRYPEDMFRVQAAVFSTYHMNDPEEFYTKQDAWTIPQDAAYLQNQRSQGQTTAEPRPMRPYYLTMRLPGEEGEEFALIQPFEIPGDDRNLMTAWLAGRSDPDHYGDVRAYVMPPNRTVFGPQQVQARINQDDAVSEQITLWNQSNSRVIYGNLLVIPVADAIVYAQPLFLAASGSEIPQLQRVVLVFGDSVVMEPTLQQALDRMFGAAAPGVDLPEGADEPAAQEPVDEDPDDEPAATVDPRLGGVLEDALQAFQEAEEALRDGDLGTYQERTQEAEELLDEARELLGDEPLPEPTPELEPTTEPTVTDG